MPRSRGGDEPDDSCGLHKREPGWRAEARMRATIIDGKAVAARVREEVAREAAAFEAELGHPPGLATVLVGDDPASEVYVSNKQRASREVGIRAFDQRLAADVTQEEVAEKIRALNDDPAV